MASHSYFRFDDDNDINYKSRVSCQKGPTRHAYAWQIRPFWQDNLEILSQSSKKKSISWELFHGYFIKSVCVTLTAARHFMGGSLLTAVLTP